MSKLYTTENHLEVKDDGDTKIGFYETENGVPQETPFESVGELYRFCVGEFGRCTGKIHVDAKSTGKTEDVGWVFVKRVKYDDCNDTYLREVWVTVYEDCDITDPRALKNGIGSVLPRRVKYM